MVTRRKSRVTSKAKKSTKSAKPGTKPRSRKSAAKSKPVKETARPERAMRLTFSYDGDEVKLISQQRVDMKVPPSDPVKGYKKQKGFWAELKTGQDKTLYRHVMHNPTRNDAEVFSDDPDKTISRAPAPKRKGVFVVMVPDADEGDAVTLSRSTPEKKGAAAGIKSLATKPADEILRFKLKK